LKKQHNYTLRPYYEIEIPTTKGFPTHDLEKWLKSRILENDKSAYGLYVATHIKVKLSPTHTLGGVINNYKQVLQYYNHYSNEAPCYCHLFPELKGEQSHIFITPHQLPSSHNQLKDLLSFSLKTPLHLDYNLYLGITFSRIHEFLRKLLFLSKWSLHANEKLYKIIHRKKSAQGYTLHVVQQIVKTYQNYFCFVPIDKNSNTCAIMCKQFYIAQHLKEFTNSKYYQLESRLSEELQLFTELNYKENIVPLLKHNTRVNRKWKLGSAYLLPKNKDLERTRPIVSFYHHHTRTLGKRIARALTVIIRSLSQH
jgi:hypothetical protein